MFFFLSHIFSSTKSENKRAKQVLLGSGAGRREVGGDKGEGGPNNVYTCQ
jgi:hypothetical protein